MVIYIALRGIFMRNQETFKEDNKYFTAILEGVNQDTVFDDFVNNRETSTNTFGKILVVRSGFCYREVITGIKIPMKFLYYSVDPNETSPYYTIPRTAFHATSVYTGEITKDVFNYYVFTNILLCISQLFSSLLNEFPKFFRIIYFHNG